MLIQGLLRMLSDKSWGASTQVEEIQLNSNVRDDKLYLAGEVQF